jgi:hypothetical protein
MILGMDFREENLTTWEDLARGLGGSFAARARGVIAPELILLTQRGEPFGRLTAGEDSITHLQAGGLTAWIEALPGATYAMTTGDEKTLTTETAGSATDLILRCGDRAYEAHVSLLRNSAVTRLSDERESARVSGGLTNRRYRAVFDPQDPVSLPVAVFLLHHTFALRRGAYRAGS